MMEQINPALDEGLSSMFEALALESLMNGEIHAGVDIISVDRLREALSSGGFREYVFSPDEITYCEEQPSSAKHYAARWAVKEAFLKAQPDPPENYDLSEIKISRQPNNIELHLNWSDSTETDFTTAASLAHDDDLQLAMGFVILLSTQS